KLRYPANRNRQLQRDQCSDDAAERAGYRRNEWSLLRPERRRGGGYLLAQSSERTPADPGRLRRPAAKTLSRGPSPRQIFEKETRPCSGTRATLHVALPSSAPRPYRSACYWLHAAAA